MKNSKAVNTINAVLSRLSSGVFNDNDIAVLFVTLRNLPSTTRVISEVGAFVAHNHKRDQGMAYDLIFRNHYLLNLTFGQYKYEIKPAINEFPAFLPRLIELQLMMLGDDFFKKELGIKTSRVIKIRSKLKGRGYYKITKGVCKLSKDMTQDDFMVIGKALSVLNTSDGMNFDSLIYDLKVVLGKEINGVDLNVIDGNKDVILCVLLCVMNNVAFELPDEIEARTIINIDSDGFVTICGQYGVVMKKEPLEVVPTLSPLFETGYKFSDIFEDDVSQLDIENDNITFSLAHRKIIKLNV